MLHYSEEITNECEMRVKCPATFGRAYIRLVSNLVGLDEQVTIDGNCKIQKSSFDLSPAVAKSSKGKKKQSKTSSVKRFPSVKQMPIPKPTSNTNSTATSNAVSSTAISANDINNMRNDFVAKQQAVQAIKPQSTV